MSDHPTTSPDRSGAAPAATLDHALMANALRALAMDAVEQAKSGHPGMPMGMADVATVLFSRFLRFDAGAPDWPDRDRFVLSAGHGSMLLYGLLHLTGYEGMELEQIRRFRQLGSHTAGHPEYGHAPGIETTTGPLGQGFANAVGMALAERMQAARYGTSIVDHRTWVIASDGDLMEGISHEAASIAGHLRLAKLTVLFDDNAITIDGGTDLSVSDDQLARFSAYGWHVAAVDGHDPDAIAGAIEAAIAEPRPSLIACRTVIGKGAPKKAGTAGVHGSPLGAEEIAGARRSLAWPYPAFEIPENVRAAWQTVGRRGREARLAWEAHLADMPENQRGTFTRALAGDLPADLGEAVTALKRRLVAERPSWASRRSSEEALEVLTAKVQELVGGSADLTGSNNTKTKATLPVRRGEFGGRYVYWGVREHAMVAAMNGIALHKGFIPYGGTFLIFTDYCRPAIRLAALMGLRVIVVATHDSIGLGEDGPTHQPVEHLAALRAMPNLFVFRPADAIETAECWLEAVRRKDGPSVLVLSRQNLPVVREHAEPEHGCAAGGYVLAEAEGGERRATLLATGSEVVIALEARRELQAEGIPTAVVSMPCFEAFERQDAAYREAVLGKGVRVAIEAAVPFGWTRYVASEGHVVGMTSFGASAPAKELYEHFGITADVAAARVRHYLRD